MYLQSWTNVTILFQNSKILVGPKFHHLMLATSRETLPCEQSLPTSCLAPAPPICFCSLPLRTGLFRAFPGNRTVEYTASLTPREACEVHWCGSLCWSFTPFYGRIIFHVWTGRSHLVYPFIFGQTLGCFHFRANNNATMPTCVQVCAWARAFNVRGCVPYTQEWIRWVRW